MSSIKQPKMDPLYIIFEQHLNNFQDSDLDRKTFIGNVIQDYLSHLRKNNLVVPKFLEEPIVQELANQVHVMLVKKIYGCMTIQDYQKGLGWGVKNTAKRKYLQLKK